MSMLDKLMSNGSNQHNKSFEASTKVERRTKDLNIFASHNNNEAIASMKTQAKVDDVMITIAVAISNTVRALRGQAGIVRDMSLGIDSTKLSTVASLYEKANNQKIDVISLYANNIKYKQALNAIASGCVITEGIEQAVPNSIKLYLKTPDDYKSRDLNLKGGYEFKGNTPVIDSFDEDSVNRVQAFVRTIANQVATKSKGMSLFDFINSIDLQHSVSTPTNNLFSDAVIIRGMDVKQLAEYLTNKFPNNLDDGLRFARENGVTNEKLQTVSILIKAVRDFNN